MRRLRDLLKRFRRDESGSFLVIFALLAIVLIATSGAVVDFTYTQTARSRAQTALDAAALALQTEITDVNAGTITQSAAEADIKTKAQQILRERLNDSSITATVDSATIDTAQSKLDLAASVTVPTAFVQLVGIRNITARLASQVTRGSKDIEISVALDITGSMAGQKLTDLKTATQWLVDHVVKTVQTPTYSKMAIVPWSQAVNVSSTYANNVRGTPIAGTSITAAAWSNASATIKAVTKASPGVVTTTTNHGFSNGDIVYITGVNGMTQLNGSTYMVKGATSTTFQLYTTNGSSAVSTSSYGKYTSAGTAQRCTLSTCEIIITSNSHGLSAGDKVFITGVSGLSSPQNVNGVQTVGAVGANTFVWTGSYGPTETAYSSGGTSYCVKYGCTYYYFLNAAGSYLLYQVNTCATERTTNAFTDSPPTTTKLGFNYMSGGAACLSQTIQPLTSDKTVLTNVVNGLTAANSTAGHLGLAWGWYMISPTFVAGIPNWPSASVPAAYGRSNLVKAVILMTDGAFNIQYCNGVQSQDSTNGTSATKINCNAPNGDSRTQARAICSAIKAAANNTILYTVGFDLGTDTASLLFLQSCASSPDTFFQADTGTDLQAAFQKIAQALETLRISH